MTTTPPSPFALASQALEKLSSLASSLPRLPAPPAWLTDEAARRVVLLLNHVLMQEPEARARLARQKGRVVRVQWRGWGAQLAATPAGLCELAAADGPPDLVLTLADESPLALAQAALKGALHGEKPAVRIEGDVQLAAEVNWLADHVRWDVEEDLARLLGDAHAHALAQAGRALAQGLRQIAAGLPGGAGRAGCSGGAADVSMNAGAPRP